MLAWLYLLVYRLQARLAVRIGWHHRDSQWLYDVIVQRMLGTVARKHWWTEKWQQYEIVNSVKMMRLKHTMLCLFQQDNAKPHSARITTECLCSKRVRVLTWPVCSTDLSPLKTAGALLNKKIQQINPTNLKRIGKKKNQKTPFRNEQMKKKKCV